LNVNGNAPTSSSAESEVARQGYAALKARRPEIITGLVNRMIAMSTRFTPTSILLMIAGRLNGRGGAAGIAANPGDPPSIGNENRKTNP
jgi:hypothetical protein